MDWQQVPATRTARMKASEIRGLLKLLDQPDILRFAGCIPDPALKDKAASAFQQYAVSEGYGPLREWIATQLEKIGVACGVDNIPITSGSQQVFDYLGKRMISPKDSVLVGWPTYLGALGAFNADEPGYDRLDFGSNRTPDDFAAKAQAAGGRVKFACLAVGFANPTGETLGLARREAVLVLADAMDIAVVADAACQTQRYDGRRCRPSLPLKSPPRAASTTAARCTAALSRNRLPPDCGRSGFADLPRSSAR